MCIRDRNCAALAEVWKGAASDVNDCCFIVSGTGIGAVSYTHLYL